MKMMLSYPATCLVDNLKVNGPSNDIKQRRISLERISTKMGKRRQSLPVLPSYLTLTQDKRMKKRRKGVTFPLGVMMQQAVSDGDVEAIEALICEHGNKAVEEREPNGLPPIMRAIFEDQLDSLKFLLKAGADVTARDPEHWNVLHVAAAMDDLHAAELILQSVKRVEKTLEMTGARNMDGERPVDLAESLEMARLLLEADLTAYRLHHDHVDPVESAILKNCSSRRLKKTSCTGDVAASEVAVLQLVKEHCERHFNCSALDHILEVKTPYRSLLHLAAAKNYPHLADYVCRHKLSSLEERDTHDGWTPLHTAAYYHSVDVAMILVRQGANLHTLTHSYQKPYELTEHELLLSLLDGDMY